ncbi:MAG: hypothetical protein QM690_11680 [Sphingobium sp.]
MKRTFLALAMLAAGLTLSGCYDDGYGYGGGLYSAGSYPYGYGGYYDGYYRPGYYGGRVYRPAPNYRPAPPPAGRRDWRGDRGNWNRGDADRGGRWNRPPREGGGEGGRGWNRPGQPGGNSGPAFGGGDRRGGARR